MIALRPFKVTSANLRKYPVINFVMEPFFSNTATFFLIQLAEPITCNFITKDTITDVFLGISRKTKLLFRRTDQNI